MFLIENRLGLEYVDNAHVRKKFSCSNAAQPGVELGRKRVPVDSAPSTLLRRLV